MNKAREILINILQDNKGKSLSIKDIIELSKLKKYNGGHKYYSKNGITKSSIYYNISSYMDKLRAVYEDELYRFNLNVEIDDGEISYIRPSEPLQN